MKHLFFTLAIACLGCCAYAQEGTIHLKNYSTISCFVTGYEDGSVLFDIDDESCSVNISDVESISFDGGAITFDSNNNPVFKKTGGGYLPASKYSVKNVNYGEYTLNGKPYKGPILTTYLNQVFAGDSPSNIIGIPVKINH